MIITVPIDAQTADTLVAEHLIDWRDYLKKENKALKALPVLKDYQAADLKSNKKYIKALNIVIEAYTWGDSK